MWPFSCNDCARYADCVNKLIAENEKWGDEDLKHRRENWKITEKYQDLLLKYKTSELQWQPITQEPPLNTRLLFASQDFSTLAWSSFTQIYDPAQRMHMVASNGYARVVSARDTGWWLNLELIKKEEVDERNSDQAGHGRVRVPPLPSTDTQGTPGG